MPELTTAPVETAIDTADELYFNDVSETPDALNRITFGNFRTSVLSGVIDLGGATSFELPNSATPTVDADGEIAVDTSVADFSHGIVKVFAGEELALVALPIAELTTPTDGHVIAYNAANDEFELVAPSGGGISIGDTIGSGTSGSVLYVDASGDLAQENASFSYDPTTNRLNVQDGIGGYGGSTVTFETDTTQNAIRFTPGGSASYWKTFVSSDLYFQFVPSSGVTRLDCFSGSFIFSSSNASAAQFDGNSTAGNTRMLIYDVDNATLERVSVGAADSGGTGFKVLRIPN